MLAAVLAAATIDELHRIDGIGASDCEMLRNGALAQPVNALTSLAYSVVGAAIIVAARLRDRPMAPAAVYGSCLIAVGIGSALFHGPQPDGSRVLHDLPILVTVLFIVLHDLDLVRSDSGRSPWGAMAIGTGAAAVITIVEPGLAAVSTAIGVGAIFVLEVVIALRRLRAVPAGGAGRILMLLVAILAAVTWVFGRTDSPACDPDATLQFHGVWHVVSACMLGLWWWLSSGVGERPSAEHRPTS